MTDSARYGSYSPAAAGRPFEPRPDHPPGGATRTWSAPPEPGAETWVDTVDETGIDPVELADDELLREIGSLHRTRLDTLRHGTDAALANHLHRTADLETEYLTRHPGREVDAARLRHGE